MKLYILIILLASLLQAKSQNINIDSLIRIESNLREQLSNQEISTKYWYNQKLLLGSYSIDAQAWFKYKKPIDILDSEYSNHITPSKIKLIIPTQYQVEEINGNKFIKFYLLNLSDSSISIPRIDATIGNFSTEILIKNKWEVLQETKGSTCGNSYWTYILDSESMIELNISNQDIITGKIETPFRIVYNHFDVPIISNTINISLNSNQVARFNHSLKTKD